MGADCGREETESPPPEPQSMAHPEAKIVDLEAKVTEVESQNSKLVSQIAELQSQLTEFQQETDAISQRPTGMALPEEVTDALRARQWTAPEKWTMPCREWIDFLQHCIGLDEFKQAKRQNRCTLFSTSLVF